MGRPLGGRGGAAAARLAGVLALGLVLAVAGCRTSAGGEGAVHVVRPGETLWRIAHHYGVSVSEIVEANRIDDVRDVPTGARLWIPRGRAGAGGPVVTARPAPERTAPAAPGRALRFEWPVRGRVTSTFGRRGRRPHEGIDIAAPRGALVRAAEAGRVIYAGELGSYGKVVVLRHDDRHETVYAHNRRLRVAHLAFVDRGEVIAEVGATGNATGPHLHFEIRRDDRPRDPLLYLP